VPPRATSAQIDAESAWVQSLPFAMTGYFDAHRVVPAVYRCLTVTIVWVVSANPATDSTLLGVIRAFDPAVEQLESRRSANGVQWRTSKISGSTNLRVNRQYVYRNHRMVKYVHELVDRVLLAGKAPNVSDATAARRDIHRTKRVP
jgi:hypothetical protein